MVFVEMVVCSSGSVALVSSRFSFLIINFSLFGCVSSSAFRMLEVIIYAGPCCDGNWIWSIEPEKAPY